ncbi:hypothetical protein Salat_0666800 [Sesamum alatum]|uniref:Uncharacterized protein n=1 Tax=Sesamum alatum TaxID=300844 RepID=A0AAE1YRW8_9LAMI|nr:hypothetical protein Salat_0666800 [Sesamum alatum]
MARSVACHGDSFAMLPKWPTRDSQNYPRSSEGQRDEVKWRNRTGEFPLADVRRLFAKPAQPLQPRAWPLQAKALYGGLAMLEAASPRSRRLEALPRAGSFAQPEACLELAPHGGLAQLKACGQASNLGALEACPVVARASSRGVTPSTSSGSALRLEGMPRDGSHGDFDLVPGVDAKFSGEHSFTLPRGIFTRVA